MAEEDVSRNVQNVLFFIMINLHIYVTLYAFFFLNVTIYKFNNEAFQILLYFEYWQILSVEDL